MTKQSGKPQILEQGKVRWDGSDKKWTLLSDGFLIVGKKTIPITHSFDIRRKEERNNFIYFELVNGDEIIQKMKASKEEFDNLVNTLPNLESRKKMFQFTVFQKDEGSKHENKVLQILKNGILDVGGQKYDLQKGWTIKREHGKKHHYLHLNIRQTTIRMKTNIANDIVAFMMELEPFRVTTEEIGNPRNVVMTRIMKVKDGIPEADNKQNLFPSGPAFCKVAPDKHYKIVQYHSLDSHRNKMSEAFHVPEDKESERDLYPDSEECCKDTEEPFQIQGSLYIEDEAVNEKCSVSLSSSNDSEGSQFMDGTISEKMMSETQTVSKKTVDGNQRSLLYDASTLTDQNTPCEVNEDLPDSLLESDNMVNDEYVQVPSVPPNDSIYALVFGNKDQPNPSMDSGFHEGEQSVQSFTPEDPVGNHRPSTVQPLKEDDVLEETSFQTSGISPRSPKDSTDDEIYQTKEETSSTMHSKADDNWSFCHPLSSINNEDTLDELDFWFKEENVKMAEKGNENKGKRLNKNADRCPKFETIRSTNSATKTNINEKKKESTMEKTSFLESIQKRFRRKPKKTDVPKEEHIELKDLKPQTQMREEINSNTIKLSSQNQSCSDDLISENLERTKRKGGDEDPIFEICENTILKGGDEDAIPETSENTKLKGDDEDATPENNENTKSKGGDEHMIPKNSANTIRKDSEEDRISETSENMIPKGGDEGRISETIDNAKRKGNDEGPISENTKNTKREAGDDKKILNVRGSDTNAQSHCNENSFGKRVSWKIPEMLIYLEIFSRLTNGVSCASPSDNSDLLLHLGRYVVTWPCMNCRGYLTAILQMLEMSDVHANAALLCQISGLLIALYQCRRHVCVLHHFPQYVVQQLGVTHQNNIAGGNVIAIQATDMSVIDERHSIVTSTLSSPCPGIHQDTTRLSTHVRPDYGTPPSDGNSPPGARVIVYPDSTSTW